MRYSLKILSLLFQVIAILLLILVLSCKQEIGRTGTAKGQNSTMDAERRLKELGIELYTPAPPVANYVRTVRSGNLVFLAGHGPRKPDGSYIIGKVGRDIDLEQAKEAARLTAISLLSSLKAEIGDLNKVKRIVRVFGMVNCVESFTNQPQVNVKHYENRLDHFWYLKAIPKMGKVLYNFS